jgi:hypothetical protein
MRAIEKQMCEAVKERRTWGLDNTRVQNMDGINMAVYLFGNHIADVNTMTNEVKVNEQTFARFPTRTTKSRLRALGADV